MCGEKAKPCTEKPYDPRSSVLKGIEEGRVKRESTKGDALWGGYREGEAREMERPKRAEGSDLGLIVLGSKKGHGFGDGM
jgi:hypothetical protein